MTLKTILISSALIAGLATATASAQPGRGEPPRTRDEVIERAAERFERADKNADGYISEDEVGGKGRRGKMMKRMFSMQDANEDGLVTLEEVQDHALERFDTIDANGDGELSDDELEAAQEERREKRQQRRG
ncbi:MAG: EF-hand domain-containing protein [Parvularculaceae bacterium]|nr:EF-hand domain-containing protein [Parvularculaceae bacterium]